MHADSVFIFYINTLKLNLTTHFPLIVTGVSNAVTSANFHYLHAAFRLPSFNTFVYDNTIH